MITCPLELNLDAGPESLPVIKHGLSDAPGAFQQVEGSAATRSLPGLGKCPGFRVQSGQCQKTLTYVTG